MVRFPSSIELLVLRLLRDAPAGLYGLELVKASKGKLRRGTVYVTLGRMEDKGFVKAHVTAAEADHPGLPRPRYRVEALGVRALDAADVFRSGLARVLP